MPRGIRLIFKMDHGRIFNPFAIHLKVLMPKDIRLIFKMYCFKMSRTNPNTTLSLKHLKTEKD